MADDRVPTYELDERVTTLDTPAVNEVQKIDLTPVEAGKTITVSFDGSNASTATAAKAAITAVEVREKLESLSTIDPGDVTVAGSTGGPFTVTFTGDLAGQNVPTLVATASAGANPTVTTVTAGAAETANPNAVKRGTGLADRTADASPLAGLDPLAERAANSGDYD